MRVGDARGPVEKGAHALPGTECSPRRFFECARRSDGNRLPLYFAMPEGNNYYEDVIRSACRRRDTMESPPAYVHRFAHPVLPGAFRPVDPGCRSASSSGGAAHPIDGPRRTVAEGCSSARPSARVADFEVHAGRGDGPSPPAPEPVAGPRACGVPPVGALASPLSSRLSLGCLSHHRASRKTTPQQMGTWGRADACSPASGMLN